MRSAGVRLEVQADHFPAGTQDEVWLPEVGVRRWVLLTLDARLRYNRLERDAIMRHGVATFVLVGGKTHAEKAAIFLEGLSRVRSLLARTDPPFIAKIYRGGRVVLWLDLAGWRGGTACKQGDGRRPT